MAASDGSPFWPADPLPLLMSLLGHCAGAGIAGCAADQAAAQEGYRRRRGEQRSGAGDRPDAPYAAELHAHDVGRQAALWSGIGGHVPEPG